MEKVLFTFKHGLGDACQFTIVLKHLKFYHPELFIGVESRVGVHSIFEGLADESLIFRKPLLHRDNYPEPFNIEFKMPLCEYGDLPSTKTTECLIEEFVDVEYQDGNQELIYPKLELYRYQITPSQEVKDKVSRFIDEEVKEPFAVLHYLGNARKVDKDLTDFQAALLIDVLESEGYRVVLLDWESKFNIADYPTPNNGIVRPDKLHPYLWNKERVGDGATIAALIDRAEVFFGIDSGPGHIAAATKTPSIIFWVNHQPAFCYDYHPNVIHYASNELRTASFDEMEHPEAFRWYDGDIDDCVRDFHEQADLAEVIAEIKAACSN